MALPYRKYLRALGVIAILSVVCVAAAVAPMRAMRARAEADRAALRPGMDAAELFAAARSWTWAFGGAGPPGPDGSPAGIQITAHADGGAGVSGPGGWDEDFPNRGAFLAGVARRRDAFAACATWRFVYKASVTPARIVLPVEMKEGKVERVGELISGD
jgi:hypothetical protein